MRRNNLTAFVLCLCVLLLLAGCNAPPTAATSTGTTPPTGSTPTPGNTPPTGSALNIGAITHPSILATQYGQDPTSVLVFDGSESKFGIPYLEIPGGLPAVDATGNLYVVSCYLGGPNHCSPGIVVYSPSGKFLRFLNPHVTSIFDMTVSGSGEIFASDGNGVAVFGPTASGDDPPVRYIRWNSAGRIAVDGSGKLYVLASDSVAVFGPTATSADIPERIIGGVDTQMSSDYGAMAVDAQGKVYVLCQTEQVDGANPFRVLVFAPNASGDAAPLRYLTSSSMIAAPYDGTGIAVDATGAVYVSASLDVSTGAVFEFPVDASGSVTPSKIISFGWWGENAGGIALH
jgi:hypothetical protein